MTAPVPRPPQRGRSHPPSLRRLAERLLRDEALLTRGDVVLCACSGGPDSTALLHVLALLQPRLGHRVLAHGVDHGLRPAASSELALAAALAARLDIPFAITRVDLAPGPNLQARARDARRTALAAAARAAGARAIATGHTADDRAETFLIRLLRGAGPRGLAVLPPSASLPPEPGLDLIRPLLLARRSDVLAHLRRHDIPFADDPSNADPRFLRTRVRREVIPLLEELSPQLVQHLCALSDMLASDRPDDPAPPLVLGRAQRLAAEKARKRGVPVQLRVQGDRVFDPAFPERQTVLIEEWQTRRRP
ncbi:tRNA lysidine(34) synthetase TilS [Chondromyces apiculatus]|uniref:tRNA(Ile)-lysidine synthase n=1 Tax=Chondromyces apiculatus DSM 436 TaxID=1192034 RepID=A0A017T5Y1_9BACT|nr:tRNA lysidine(34) synthetase TilS [Chondromyces apiculatus]EYF04432.1 tRNA(Ile)-lysidine synthetase [Chondromyces apiculatus DSM 436]